MGTGSKAGDSGGRTGGRGKGRGETRAPQWRPEHRPPKAGRFEGESEKKLAKYKAALVRDFDAAMGAGAGEAWFAQYAQPVADALMA